MKNLIYILLILPWIAFTQNEVKGMIMEANDKNEHRPLPGANVYWLNTTVGTVTDIDGEFSVPYESSYTQLVISYVGFKTDTLTITEPKMVHHWLQPTNSLNEVTVKGKKKAAYFECQDCGYKDHADKNAARNLSDLNIVKRIEVAQNNLN